MRGIRVLLYGEGYTIRGVQKIFKDDGAAVIVAIGRGEAKARKPNFWPRRRRRPHRQSGAAHRQGCGTACRPSAAGPPHRRGPKVIHKLTGGQTDTLKAALRDLTDARKLLDPTTHAEP